MKCRYCILLGGTEILFNVQGSNIVSESFSSTTNILTDCLKALILKAIIISDKPPQINAYLSKNTKTPGAFIQDNTVGIFGLFLQWIMPAYDTFPYYIFKESIFTVFFQFIMKEFFFLTLKSSIPESHTQNQIELFYMHTHTIRMGL